MWGSPDVYPCEQPREEPAQFNVRLDSANTLVAAEVTNRAETKCQSNPYFLHTLTWCDPQDDTVRTEGDTIDVAEHIQLAAGILADTEKR